MLPKKLASNKVEYEAELAVVIGKHCHNVDEKDALAMCLDTLVRTMSAPAIGKNRAAAVSGAVAKPLPHFVLSAQCWSQPMLFRIQTRLLSAVY